MVNAVSHLHQKNICHLDLKLANFVRNSEDNLKLIDFGHARSSLVPVRSVLGTSEYNSAERYNSAYDGAKADIFSLGICLTGLMVGYVPASTSKQSFPTTSTFLKRPEYFWDLLESKTSKLSPDFPGLDSEAVSLIESMVNPEPSLRPDIATIQTHSFFNL
jgi:serine/threonine protein kinase